MAIAPPDGSPGRKAIRTIVDVDLGTERSVRAVQLLLGPFIEDFPRMLSIEMLGEGAVWKELYRGGAAGRAFVGRSNRRKTCP
jgi:hypothetical protein